jgi:hypothetical protein
MRHTFLTFLLFACVTVGTSFLLPQRDSSARQRRQAVRHLSTTSSDDSTIQHDSPKKIYLDIAVADEPIGRLVFVLPQPESIFPLHTENLLKLVSQERRSIDPMCHYIKSEFSYSPQFIEGVAQYRWAHVLPGRSRNAVGRPTERIADPGSMNQHSHSIYGGTYYGLPYESIPSPDAAVLTVPMTGPGRGSTALSIVRVAESPKEWRERLLLNSVVLGWMDTSSMDTLLLMARQTRGPPTVIDSGILDE